MGMASFASPLFWQIHYLVTNLNKKNFKSSVAELNQLVELYGKDAHIFLLSCLVEEIDFRDVKSHHHKDALKIQLLTHEMAQATTTPQFTTYICEAIEGGAKCSKGRSGSPSNRQMSEEYLNQFCKLLKLNIPQQIAIGLALSTSSKQPSEALRFLKSKIPELSSSGSKLNSDVLHSLLYALQTNDEFTENPGITSTLISSLKLVHPEIDSSFDFMPLQLDSYSPVDFTMDKSLEDDILAIVNEMEELKSYQEIMENYGYECTSSVGALRKVFSEVNSKTTPLGAREVAEILIMIARTDKNLSCNEHAVLFSELQTLNESTAESSLQSWNIEVLSEVIKQDAPNLDWKDVAFFLDSQELELKSQHSFSVLISAYKSCSGVEFPVDCLFKEWKNKQAHLQFMKWAIEAPKNLICFSNVKDKVVPFEGADFTRVPDNEAWLSLEVVSTLIMLSDSDIRSDVKRVFDTPKSQCPDVLIAGLAKVRPSWSGLRADLFAEVFGECIHSRPNAPAMLQFLWNIDSNLVLHSSVRVFNSVPANSNILSRLFALLRNTQDALTVALHSSYFSFAIALAVMGANHDLLNLENWMKERLGSHRNQFAIACLVYIRSVYARAQPRCKITPDTSGLLSIESLSLMLKTLFVAQAMFNREMSIDFKDLYSVCANAHPIVASSAQISNSQPQQTGSSSLSPEEIEKQANAYFQQIYTSKQSIEEVIQMLKRFKNSDSEGEKSIFVCMIHNLFDEYRFFHKYPEKELRITGVLFGSLIQHQLVTQMTLSLALRYVLDALRKPIGSNLSRFGAYALEQFITRLPEMPQYCSHLAQIPHLRQGFPELVFKIDQVISDSRPQSAVSSDSTSDKVKQTVAQTAIPSSAPNRSTVRDNGPASSPTKSMSPSYSASGSATPNSIDLLPQHKVAPSTISVDHIFGSESLESEETYSIEDKIQDRIHFIINNISISNLEAKLNEVKEFLESEHHPWLANYLVVKRISTQPNYHGVYLILVEKLEQPGLEQQILTKTLQNVRKLLVSNTITTNSQERSLLKNLGSWIGLFTLSRNMPLLQRCIDLKELLYVGYETGRLIAITPFVAKILDGCKKSKIFKPPNPWVMGLMSAMREIYDVSDLKLNIKFEIEVLCKALKVKVDELRKGDTLQNRAVPPRTCNPDFNIRSDPKVNQIPSQSTASNSSTSAVDRRDTKLIDDARTKSNSPASQSPSFAGTSAQNIPSSPATSSGTTGQFPAGFQETTVIPNLASYVTINPAITLFQQHSNLKRAVPVAVDRAIREIIQPVVERSVTIACITSREMILKDFAMEGDENKMRKAAHLMVSNLAGSLALVTCKEPLRVSMGNHLRSMLSSTTNEQQQVEQVVQVCSSENLELGCMLIEKAATEKAMRDIDEALGPAYSSRRRHREQSSQPFYDVSYFSSGSRFPGALPEMFRPKPGGLQHQQLLVYEAYQRIPKQPIVPPVRAGFTSPQGGPSNSGGAPGKSNSNPSILQIITEKFSSLLDRLEQAVQKVVRQPSAPVLLSSLSQDHEIIAILRDARMLIPQIQPNIRDEAIVSFAQRILKRLYALGPGDDLLLDALVGYLDCLNEGCKKLRVELTGWILRTQVDDKINLHCQIIIRIVGMKILRLMEFDVYLTRNMEQNISSVEFAVHLIRQCLPMSHINIAQELPSTIEWLGRLVDRLGSTNKQVAGIVKLLEQVRSQSTSDPKSGSRSPAVIGQKSILASPTSNSSLETAAFRHTVSGAMEHWINICKESPGNEKVYGQFLNLLKQNGLMKDEETTMLFFKVATELCVEACIKSSCNGTKGGKVQLTYTVLDCLPKLITFLVKYADPNSNVKVNILNKGVNSIAGVMVRAYDARRTNGMVFDQRVFFRMFVCLMQELTTPDPALDSISFQILQTFAGIYNRLQPLAFPGLALSWMELISHRTFMPHLLLAKQQRGWPILHRLLVNILLFLQPYLRAVVMTTAVRVMYKGTLRIMLVLLHDFPEFLCDFHTSFCDVLPPTCVQLRNLILSAFPRNMRLPDPLTPGLQVPLLPEISKPPRLPPNCMAALGHKNLKQDMTSFLTHRQPMSFLLELPSKLLLAVNQSNSSGSKYSVPTLNALVLYVGTHAIAQLQNSDNASDANAPKGVFQQGPAMDVFQHLAKDLDMEGRYLFFSAIVNHLRYPNSHTHYYSCLLLFLFMSATQEVVKEQITRVLLERLIAHRPHPWGLLITFIELIRNKSYNFWDQPFLETSNEIKMVFDDVARGCMGPNGTGSGTTSNSSVHSEIGKSNTDSSILDASPISKGSKSEESS